MNLYLSSSFSLYLNNDFVVVVVVVVNEKRNRIDLDLTKTSI